jgi:hypothetical protein
VTQPDFDHADWLRRALHAEADSIEPAGDGLERIRARLTAPRPAPVAWITAALAGTAGRALGGLESVRAWLESVWSRLRAALGTVREQFRMPPPGPSAERLRLVRHPVVVAAAGLLAAVVVTFALAPLPGQAVSQAVALIWSFESGGSASAASGPAVSGPGTQPGTAGATGAAHGKPGHKNPASASCTARASAAVAACPSPGACPSPAASAHPSHGPSPTATPTPTATPSPSATPASSATPPSSTGARACPTPSSSASPHPSASSSPSPPTSSPTPSPPSSSPTPSPPSSSPAPSPSADPASSPAPSPSADPAGSPAPSPSADPSPAPNPSGSDVAGGAGER